MTSAFFTSDVIENRVEVQQRVADSVVDAFEIDRCVEWISAHDYKRVALQFPDDLLVDSAAVVDLLGQRLKDVATCVLGDTSYGSCCVDEVAAEHYSSDSLIHFGRACLSPTGRLPILYVFVSQDVDVDHCCEEFRRLHPDVDERVVILTDVIYAHCLDVLISKLKQTHTNIIGSALNYSNEEAQPASQSEDHMTCSKCGRLFYLPSDSNVADYKIFYIGSEGPAFTNLMMNYNTCTFSSYDPSLRSGRLETLDINRALMKRFYMIERAKDAEIVGIVVGTLGVSDYLQVIEHLKSIITKAGKKFYLFVMGKLNVPKLANFPEIDVYVLVACPENTLIDSSEFFKPVVTPFEMEHACNLARVWTGDYVTDFRTLLPGAPDHCAMPEGMGVTYDVSLITGQIRTIGVEEKESTGSSDAVATRNENTTVAHLHTAGDYLANRSWQGLEQKLGETPVTRAVEGIKGIASGYAHEAQD